MPSEAGAFASLQVTGIGALLASLIFGVIWTRVSADAAFLTGAALAGLATLLLYFLFPERAERSGRGAPRSEASQAGCRGPRL